jgi:ABC-type microcin C transport system permease subunit YejE
MQIYFNFWVCILQGTPSQILIGVLRTLHFLIVVYSFLNEFKNEYAITIKVEVGWIG